MGKLDGRVAIVTGAAQGIGAAFAKALASEGSRLVIADLDTGASVVEEIRSAGGVAVDVPPDVSTKDGCENMVSKAIESFGRLDILVNNAAIFTAVERKNFDDIPVDEWDAVMGERARRLAWLLRRSGNAQKRIRQDYLDFHRPRFQGNTLFSALRRVESGSDWHYALSRARGR